MVRPYLVVRHRPSSALLCRSCTLATPSTSFARLLLPRRRPHSHSHGPHDHSHATEIGWSSPSQRITLVGLGSNVFLTGGKLWAGVTYGSTALVADALHSASDMLSDIVTLATLRLSHRPASPRFPGKHGLAKVEPLGAFFVSSLLVGGGLSVGYSSLSKLLTIYGYDSLTSSHEGHTHGLALLEHGSSMPMAAFYVAAGTIIAKEALYRATISVAKSEDSSLLKAQAWHHRSDALSTLVALVAVGGSTMGFPLGDPLGGLAVSVLVARAGYSTLRSSILTLLDAVDPLAHAKYRKVLLEIVPSLKGEDISLRRVGGVDVVTIQVELPNEMLDEVEALVTRWQSELRERTGEAKVELRVRSRHLELS